MPKNKRVYMGPNSTAGIFSRGAINEDWEVLMNVYGTAYDSLDGVMLTRDPGRLDKATVMEVRGRFLILKKLAKKHCPSKLHKIERIEQICLGNIRGHNTDAQAHAQIRQLTASDRKINNPLLNGIEAKVNAAQSQANFNFTHPIANLMKQTNHTKKRGGTHNRRHNNISPFFKPPSSSPKKRKTVKRPRTIVDGNINIFGMPIKKGRRR